MTSGQVYTRLDWTVWNKTALTLCFGQLRNRYGTPIELKHIQCMYYGCIYTADLEPP